MTIKHLFFVGLLLITFFFFSPMSMANPQSVEIYVSPNGNDKWSGQFANPNTSVTDGPVRTLEKARDIVRRLKKNNSSATITVYIRQGIYVRTKPFVLGIKDSGTKNAPILWRNYNNENVQIIGGVEVSGFNAISDKAVLNKLSKAAKANVLQLDLKSLGVTDYGKVTSRGSPGFELFFNDKRMQLARWPNEGWTMIAGVPQTGTLIHKGNLNNSKSGKHFGRFSFSEERPLNWSNTNNIVLHGYWCWDWYDEFLQVKSIDKENREIHIASPHSLYGLCEGQRYYALNILEELDHASEWYLDRKTGMLYFWPPHVISQSRSYISLLSKPLFVLNNTHNISITGLTFEFSRGSAVVINGGSDNHIAGCTIRNIGETAIKINGGDHNGITSCDIYDVSSSAINLFGGDRSSLTPAHNFAVNNHIYNYSSWIRTYQPAIKVKGVGNRIAHNAIHDAPHAGIVLSGNEHIVEYNDIYRVAKETGDVGAFYMGRDWTQRGNVIRHNYFHELTASGVFGVNAIYLDDWSSATNIYGNVFFKAGRGIKVGGGRDNIVRDNFFIDSNPSIQVDSRGIGWGKYFFDGTNKILFDRMDAMNYDKPPYSVKYPELLDLYGDDPAIAKNNRIFNNLSTSDNWLDLKDGLDLNIVDVHDNIVFQMEGEYLNPRDIVLPEDNFIEVFDGQLMVDESIQLQYDIKVPDLKNIGNFEDEFRSIR